MYEFLISILTISFIYIILVISLNLTFGFTGLVNLGHMAFFGVGAYTSALLTLQGIPWYFALPLAGILAAILGAIISIITVGLKGDYFQIVTLGLAFIAIAVSRNWISLTRGALGLPGVPEIIKNNFYYMLFVMIISIVCVIFFYWLTNLETGKIFQAIRDDETATAILGKNTLFYKVLSITISTFFAGIAGSLYVHYIQFVDPNIFDLEFFVLILSMLIIGGLASIKGSIMGVFALSILTESMRFIVKGYSLGFISITYDIFTRAMMVLLLVISSLVLVILITRGLSLKKRLSIGVSILLIISLANLLVYTNPQLIGAMRQMLFMLVLLLILIYRPRGIFGKVDV